MFDPKNLLGKWVHSHEEDTGDLLVYRHAEYPFPRSRGRDGLELLASGVATATMIAPTDGNQSKTGQWKLTPDDTLLVKGKDGKSIQSTKVISAETGKLVLAR